LGHTLGDSSESTLVLEAGGVAKCRLLLVAVGLGDRVDGRVDSWDIDLGVLNDLAVLNVDAADLGEGTAGGTGVGDELSDDGEFLGGVDSQSCTVEGLVTLAEGVEIATIGIADTGVAAGGSASITLAASLRVDCARMGSVGSGVVVGFPDIHLVATGTVWTSTSVDVVGGCGPAVGVGLC